MGEVDEEMEGGRRRRRTYHDAPPGLARLPRRPLPTPSGGPSQKF
jgi:hypothetical protein